MIISVTLSKPVKNVEQILGRAYQRIKIRAANNASAQNAYFAELFTEKQAFHEQKTADELNEFIERHAGTTFKNCIIRTESDETTILANKKGKITRLVKKLDASTYSAASEAASCEQKDGAQKRNDLGAPAHKGTALRQLAPGTAGQNRKKNYLIPEGTAVPFLVLLGVMTSDGKVISAKYDKFRQINRFLEFINDVLPAVTAKTNGRPLRIADFGCGKSYLTFAVHYFLTQIKKLDVEIIGLDLKKDVIDYCNRITRELNLSGLRFDTGNIDGYAYNHAPDIVITLHACDTATDFALDYAVKHGCKAILSVPCCQHELNAQLSRKDAPAEFQTILRHGIIRERFSALLTDALRADYLESAGYAVQLLEFIDIEHTPKNILIRAVKKSSGSRQSPPTAHQSETQSADAVTRALGLTPTLSTLLK